jgi:hypothetical protein
MTRHRYLRAYMAGVAVSTLCFLLLLLVTFIVSAFHKGKKMEDPKLRPDEAVELVVFSMVMVPNVFGFWNMLYVAVRRRRNWPLGLHGALAPFVIFPIGVIHARAMHAFTLVPGGYVHFGQMITYRHFAILFTVEVVVYYLVWKYAVGFFNRTLELPS